MKRRPIFAWFYEFLSRAENAMIRGFRDEVAGSARGRVLEIGAGNGLNFAHYRDAGPVIAADPEPAMAARARPRARAAPVPVLLVRAAAEALPFRDGSFDTVIASLVLCSVADPRRAVEEAARVLAPGGEIRLFEHVRSKAPEIARRQDLLNRPYGWFAGGCNMNRDTLGTLRLAGFRVRYRRLSYGPAHAPHVIGVATRP